MSGVAAWGRGATELEVSRGGVRRPRLQDYRPLWPGSLAVARTGLRAGRGLVDVALVFVVEVVVVDVVEELGDTTTGEQRAESDSGPERP